MVESNLSKIYILLSTYELIELRLRLNITCLTADHLFDLPEGSYESFENGFRIQSIREDNSIRMTECFNKHGRSILPISMQIQRINNAN